MSHTSGAHRGAQVSLPPPVVFLASIFLGVACRYAIAAAHVPLAAALRLAAGLLVILAGLGLMLSARVLFTRSGQSPTPWTPTPSLIFQGPYRYTRNPMYLGATLVVIGCGLAFDNLWIALLALPALLIVHVSAVLPEERYLSGRFGDRYTQYLGRVRRYL